jgi:hypothetical protein
MTTMPSQRRIIALNDLVTALENREPLRNVVIQGLDLGEVPSDVWANAQLRGAMFLGCAYPEPIGAFLRTGKALMFPKFEELPYEPYRTTLYTPAELQLRTQTDLPTADEIIYAHFVKYGRYNPGFAEALAQRIHDFSIEDAMSDLIGRSQSQRKHVVGIMGGHAIRRDDPEYARVAELAWRLAQEDYLVTTGGGPGVMEAGNFGAYMARYKLTDLAEAHAMLMAAPQASMTDKRYNEVAQAVLQKYPNGTPSLAVPTWFYGFEPTSLFPSHIAKYFSNSLREDGLLEICVGGVVYAKGGAGTNQEIFLDAAQNHYGSLDFISPMAFLGTEHYVDRTSLYPTLQKVAAGRTFAAMLTLSDSPADIVEFMKSHPPIPAPA